MPNLFSKAKRLLLHPEELLALLGQGAKKAYAKRALLVWVFAEFLVLFRLVRAWALGHYQAPRQVVFWAVVAILYFISPLDAIPDIFPGGYIDDIGVITFIVNRMKADLTKFQDWEKKRKGVS